MPTPVILFYSPTPAPYGSKLLQLCAVQGIRLRTMAPADLDRSLSSLVQSSPSPEIPSPGEPLPEPLLILCRLSDRQLDRALLSMRQAQIRCLTAVLTPSNAVWTPRTLYGELVRERSQLGGAHAQ